jgi:uncharacterized protein YijF (DUF1287 family)
MPAVREAESSSQGDAGFQPGAAPDAQSRPLQHFATIGTDAPTKEGMCRPENPRLNAPGPPPLRFTLDVDSPTFGTRLAAAAVAQTNDLVVYSAKYRRIGFPMGDMSPFYGACTDLVIRAYRALGIDLQQLVQQARLGSGDASVDHRRTETLRRLFARYGQSLPVSPFPEDYQAGDIVTYERPFSRVSRSHIAIVADTIAPTGRPMIIHNRGWGPQVEDALFVDRITGHYRFSTPPPTAERTTTRPAPPIRVGSLSLVRRRAKAQP